jgi:hypothetical protein
MQIAYSDLERLIRPADTAKRDQNAKGDQKPGHINSPKIRPRRFPLDALQHPAPAFFAQGHADRRMTPRLSFQVTIFIVPRNDDGSRRNSPQLEIALCSPSVRSR